MLGILLVSCAIGLAQETVRFARSPDISPDGKLVAFSYMSDIWIVDSVGGVARPLTSHPAHDIGPVFSPDGKWIAFSSNRYGSYDLFVIPVEGGRPRRLTFDSANEWVSDWSPDGKYILFTSRKGLDFPPQDELYQIPVEGGRETRITLFEGREGAISPRGDRLAYVRGPGLWYRRGYRGSSDTDLWICDRDGRNNKQLTSFDGLDQCPMWAPDGQTLYYVTEHYGVSNICKLDLAGKSQPQPLTAHSGDGVRRARISRNGECIVYECGPELWICSTRGSIAPRPIPIAARADDKTNPDQVVTFTGQISEYRIAPNEQYAALVIHGEIFLVALGDRPVTARRLTHHPAHDRQPAWSPDMKRIVFVSDRSGWNDIYALESDDPAHSELVRAHQFKVTQLTKTPESEAAVSYSPDGKWIAFIRDGRLWLMKPDGSDLRAVVNDPQVIEYEWSPDSRWLVYSRMDQYFASELYLVPVQGGEASNITRYATRNFSMSFTADGRLLTFVSQRRQDLDVFVLPMRRIDRLSEPSKTGPDLEDIHLRAQRVTALSSDESEAVVRPDGQMVAFRSNVLGNDDLWISNLSGAQLTRLTSGGLAPRNLTWNRAGTTLYFLDRDGNLRYVRPGTITAPLDAANVPRLTFTARMTINREDQFAQMFDECWRKLREHFYDPRYHGVDWEKVRHKYRPLVGSIATHEDFYDLVSLMLGELNASHLGISGRGRTPEEETADLGIIWDPTHTGPGLKIKEILRHGPADRAGASLQPGDTVVAMDNVELTPSVNVSKVLNGKVNETVVLQVTRGDSKERRRVEIRAAARNQIANLMYRRWVEANARRVAELSGGRVGYIHLRAMDTQSLDEFVRALYTDHFDKEALILDVRYNGGGFTHDQVLAYLGAREHTYFVSRDGRRGAVLRAHDRKWTRPVVVLCNNRSYSDAEIFPYAFRSLGLGKLVGTPTGGYVIGTVNERLIDGSLFRVPRLGVFTVSGTNLENTGVIPDVVVDTHPDDIARGVDAQLDKGVETVLLELQEWKKKQKTTIAAPAAQSSQPLPGSPPPPAERK
ncbi:MAG: MdsD protein [Gemmataceae bacterium]